jgi:DNA-binding GntR family transcriptional regulator
MLDYYRANIATHRAGTATVNEPDPRDDPRKYIRLAADLRARIADGSLPRGEPAPSRTKLAEQTGWSPLTCVKALRMLESEGLLALYPGLGYYVK